MNLNNFIGILSQIGTFMIIFSICFFSINFLINIVFKFKNKNIILFKKISLDDLISTLLSIFIIFNFIKIFPSI